MNTNTDRASPPPFSIRSATLDDVANIRVLVRAAYAKWVPVIGREPMPMNADYDQAVREHEVDILYVDGKMAGLLEVMTHPGHLWIENVVVAPESQGNGWGRHLLAHAEGKAVTAGLPEIRLLTNGAFEANIALYTAIGYGIDKIDPFMSGTVVFMSKRLTR